MQKENKTIVSVIPVNDCDSVWEEDGKIRYEPIFALALVNVEVEDKFNPFYQSVIPLVDCGDEGLLDASAMINYKGLVRRKAELIREINSHPEK